MATTTDKILVAKDATGTEITVLDVGWNSRVQFNLTSLWPGISALAGTLTKNGTTIATLAYDASTQKVVPTWTGNTGGVIAVANGDVIKATITSPVSYTNQFTVKRIQPNWGNNMNLAYILQTLRTAGLVGRTLPEILQDGISKINASYATPLFGVSNNTALNIDRIQAYLKDSAQLTLLA